MNRPSHTEIVAVEAQIRALRAQMRPDAPQVHPRCTLNVGHGSKFGRKKEAAIAALLAERNLAEAARVVGIDLSTLKRWLRLPEFLEEYRRARWEVVEQAYARVQQNTPAAASVLLKLMADPATPASARIRAALGAFGLAREALDLDIETRVAELERLADSAKRPRQRSAIVTLSSTKALPGPAITPTQISAPSLGSSETDEEDVG